MSRIDALIAERCPDGVAFRTLGEVGEFVRGNGLQKKDFIDDGFPCIHYGQIYTFYGTSTTTTKSFVAPELAARLKQAEKGDLVITTTSENIEDVCTTVAWLGDSPIAIGGHSCVYRHTLDPMYAAYYFQTEQFELQKRKFVTGTKVKDIKVSDIGRIKIPVPPLAIQREIAEILSKMESLKAELEAELEYRSRQYAYYRDSHLTFAERDRVRWATLSEIADVRTGQAPADGLLVNSSDFPYVNAGTTASGSASRANTGGEAITIPSRGQGGVGIVGYQANDFWCGPLCYRIRSNLAEVSTKYVYYFLKSIQNSIRGLQQTGGTPALNRKELVLVKIALPPLHEQERIVAILDKFDALVNDLSIGLPAEIKARRQQYEYYRDRLLRFEESAA